jgi:hypothetical protein
LQEQTIIAKSDFRGRLAAFDMALQPEFRNGAAMSHP